MVNQASLYNPLTLAYLGDAVLDLYIRNYIVREKNRKPNELHRYATFFVSAKSQAQTYDSLIGNNFFTDEEMDILMRGRNAKSHTKAKNTDVVTYKKSTGLEAVIGYLHLNDDNERLDALLDEIVLLCEKRGKDEHK
ncbi:Mini-ribonuclease 3 [Macrococcoides canis]|uniref:Mini-ribonuclease 3 n=1 Tax=Macrococcoides canis TaxID=1855823 RepID=A0A4R6C495_9STAP|nr:Mini-ribonuclease 3 [Macrococcus canis]MEE1108023.1 Mini-ribonuclease 3 [Macrococcus canis]TDM16425.1 ribonuclease III [Macrococcus canis]TDM19874.1 ribonuclease III [Macrococcus canis]TDM22086.1 ribonuclease III [Macrococcus canis]TDM29718.1 ribonuclease III [Macrococcus canis]